MRKYNCYIVLACIWMLITLPIQGQNISKTFYFDKKDLKIEKESISDEVENSITFLDFYKENINNSYELPYIVKFFFIPDNNKNIVLSFNNSDPICIPIEGCLKKPERYLPTSMESLTDKIDSNIISNTRFLKQVEIISDGYIDGNKRIVGIKMFPILYQETNNSLLFYESISITLRCESDNPKANQIIAKSIGPVHMSRNLYQDIDFIENKNDLSKITTYTSMKRPGYAIITTANLKKSLLPLMLWRRQLGLDAYIITIEEILSDDRFPEDCVSHLNDDAGKLREYLRFAYTNNNLQYAFLVGKPTEIPFRYAEEVPSDLYFSDLNGNWNSNNNNIYGETEDSVDAFPEIFVGRLLCYNPDEVENYLYKLFTYEQNPGFGDASYLKKALYTEEAQMQDNQEAEYIRDSICDIFPIDTIFREDKNLDENDVPNNPKGKDIIDEMSNGYGLCSWAGHGSPCSISVSSNIMKRTTGLRHRFMIAHDSCWQSEGYRETGNTFMDLKNYKKPCIAYTISCSTMPYDLKELNAERDSVYKFNLGEAYTVKNKAGGVAYLGYTRNGLVRYSTYLECEFFKQLRGLGNLELGRAEALSKALYTGAFNTWMQHRHNLLGCPRIPMWTEVPIKMNIRYTKLDNGSIKVISDIPETIFVATSLFDTDFCQIKNGSEAEFNNLPDNCIITLHKKNYLPFVLPVKISKVIINDCHFIKANKVYIGDDQYNCSETKLVVGADLVIDASEEVEISNDLSVEMGAKFEIRTNNGYSNPFHTGNKTSRYN